MSNEIDKKILNIERQISDIINRSDAEKEHVESIEEKLDTIHVDIMELIGLWNNAKGFITVMRVMGTTFKWITGVGLSIGALYMLLKTGNK